MRELENELERAILLSQDELEWEAPRGVEAVAKGSLDDIVTEAIRNALRRTRGRIYGERGAARLLGLVPSTLQTKMRKHGIDRADFVD